MKKTPHQEFVDTLHRQFTPDIRHKKDFRNDKVNHNSEVDDVMKKLARKFDGLFSDLDDS